MSEQSKTGGSNSEDMALIGVNYRGDVTAALALRDATKTEVREFYRSMADTDRDVERTTVEDARARFRW